MDNQVSKPSTINAPPPVDTRALFAENISDIVKSPVLSANDKTYDHAQSASAQQQEKFEFGQNAIKAAAAGYHNVENSLAETQSAEEAKKEKSDVIQRITLNQLMAQIDAQIAEIDNQIYATKMRIAEIQVERQELTEEKTVLQDVKAVEENKLEEAQEELGQIGNNLKEAAEDVIAAQTDVAESEELIAESEGGMARKEAFKDRNQAILNLNTTESKYNQQREVYGEQVAKVKELKQGIEKIDNQIEEIDSQIAELDLEEVGEQQKLDGLNQRKQMLVETKNYLEENKDSGLSVNEIVKGLPEEMKPYAEEYIKQDINTPEWQAWYKEEYPEQSYVKAKEGTMRAEIDQINGTDQNYDKNGIVQSSPVDPNANFSSTTPTASTTASPTAAGEDGLGVQTPVQLQSSFGSAVNNQLSEVAQSPANQLAANNVTAPAATMPAGP